MSILAIERIIPSEYDPGAPLVKEHIYRYLFALREVQDGETVLDAACGVGYGTAMLAERACEVIGIDNSREAIDYAEKHYHKPNIIYLLKDLDMEDISKLSVHVSVCLETLEHLKRPQDFLETLKKITSRAIVLSTPIVPTKHENQYHLHDWTQQDIERMMFPWPVKTFERQGIYGLWVFKGPRTVLSGLFAGAKLGVEAEVIKGQPVATGV